MLKYQQRNVRFQNSKQDEGTETSSSQKRRRDKIFATAAVYTTCNSIQITQYDAKVYNSSEIETSNNYDDDKVAFVLPRPL